MKRWETRFDVPNKKKHVITTTIDTWLWRKISFWIKVGLWVGATWLRYSVLRDENSLVPNRIKSLTRTGETHTLVSTLDLTFGREVREWEGPYGRTDTRVFFTRPKVPTVDRLKGGDIDEDGTNEYWDFGCPGRKGCRGGDLQTPLRLYILLVPLSRSG